ANSANASRTFPRMFSSATTLEWQVPPLEPNPRPAQLPAVLAGRRPPENSARRVVLLQLALGRPISRQVRPHAAAPCDRRPAVARLQRACSGPECNNVPSTWPKSQLSHGSIGRPQRTQTVIPAATTGLSSLRPALCS